MFGKRLVPAVIVLCVPFISSCRDHAPTLEPQRTGSFSLVDGTTTGNPHFYFLQPLGIKNAGGNPGGWNPGTYNVTTLSPTVEILCVSDCDPASTTTFSGSDVQVYNSHYQADISGNNVPLTLNGTYRISVWVGASHVLGQVVHVIADNAQRNLSVKFRIEDGALCYDGATPLATCGTGTVGPDEEGVITVPLGDDVIASLVVKPGYRAVPTTFLFTRLTDLPCLDTDYAQFEGCFSLTLDPALEPGELFAEGTVWVGYCLDPRVRKNYVEKQKSPDKPWSGGEGIQALEYYDGNVPHIPDEANLDCNNFEVTGPVVATATQRLRRALRGPLAFVFGQKLVADDLARHASIRDASRFGFARLLNVATSAPTVALANTPVDLSATARYHASQNARDAGLGHHHGDYVWALPAHFRHGGATLCSAFTGGTNDPYLPVDPSLPQSGTATCQHTFASAGTYNIVPNVDGKDYAAFTVTVTDWLATFLTPLANSNPSPLPVQNTTGAGFLRITCAGSGCTFATLNLPYSSKDYKGGKYQLNWKIAGAAAGDLLTFQVLLGSTPLPHVSSIVVASDPKYNVGSTLPAAWRIERLIQ